MKHSNPARSTPTDPPRGAGVDYETGEMIDTGDGWGAPCEVSPDTVVRLGNGKLLFDSTAYVFGDWAVHRSTGLDGIHPHPDPNSWAVSHVPSGRENGLAVELEFWDAVRIARALEDACPSLVVSANGIIDVDEFFLFEAAIGAALQDHYVWPLQLGGLP